MVYFSPIGLSTYTRLEHLKKTIQALQNNTIASKSELYFFSDAPKMGDEEKVEKIRQYLKTVTGFKSVTIIEREENNRVRNNRCGMKQLLDCYGKVIFLEEDIVTASGFLQFMNDALDFYANDNRIISITGYCPPCILPDRYSHDTFLLPRFNAWGFATWKAKFDPFIFTTTGFEKKKNNRHFVKKLAAGGGDIYGMIEADCQGRIDALDVKVMYYQALNNKYTIYPRQSLVQNIGHDGSGVHCGSTTKFHIDRLWQKNKSFVILDRVKVNKDILHLNQQFRAKEKKESNVSKFIREIAILAGLGKIRDVFTGQ